MGYYSRSSRRDRYQEDRWPAYVPVAERRRKAALEMDKLRKKGQVVSPVTIEGRVIAKTFWGKAWCDNLESYHDFANRLDRGRTYVRNGSVVDLQIAPREVTATVSGSELYKIKIKIDDVPKQQWGAICTDCVGGIDSLVELLQGRFSKGVMERICRQGDGLFPKPNEIRFSCSCPDFAYMCKHVAAVLYGVGARLDTQPELLFRLRAVDEKELVSQVDAAVPLSKSGPAADKVLNSDDLSALFGLEMEQDAPAAEKPVASKPATARKAAKPKATAGAAKKAAVETAKPQASGRAAQANVVNRKTTSRASGVAAAKPVASKNAPANKRVLGKTKVSRPEAPAQPKSAGRTGGKRELEKVAGR